MRLIKYLRRNAIRIFSKYEKPLLASGNIPRSWLNLPDFLGIGAMKSGTTWLHENLKHHPQIFLPQNKETYYFTIKFDEYSLLSYSRQFAHGKGLVKGDITPGYGILEEQRIRYIKKLMPDVKLIMLLRNPVDRSWSEAYMNLVVKPKRDISTIPEHEFCDYFKSEKCYGRSNYILILDEWLRVFPAGQLFVGFFDDIADRPKKLLLDIFNFLGVSQDVNWSSLPYNKVILPKYETYGGVHGGGIVTGHKGAGCHMPEKYRQLLAQMFSEQLDELHSRFGDPVRKWLA